jgi:hypothetical protein
MNPKFDQQKILDPELVKFAEQDKEDTVSVIIELPVEQAQIELTETRPNEDIFVPFATLPIDEDTERQKMDQLESELKKLGVDNLIRLDTAWAFVVDLTPSQLRAVSLLANTGYVRLNRTHRIGGGLK